MIPTQLAESLRTLVETETDELDEIEDETASLSPDRPGAWSKKQELGHLIDSATNNHARFVLAALSAGEFRGSSYAQNAWVDLHGYQDLSWEDLVTFWCSYNLLLEHLIGRLPEAQLEVKCLVGDNQPVTLGWLIHDYIVHMQHHLDHILDRDAVTPYPQA